MDLFELRDRVQTLPALEKRMSLLRNEIREATSAVSDLLWKYKQESRDVEQIKKESLSSFMLKVFGKYENKLEKEQREEIEAKLAYDRAVTHLESLEQQKNELAGNISALQADNKAYQTELENRRGELTGGQTAPEGAQYAELEKERNTIISQMTEINQALSAASRAKSTAQSARESLVSARKWATYDAFTRGGIISHMTKYSHIDDAERSFHSLSSQLRQLKSELNDVREIGASEFNEISSRQRTIDFWFDNIFTDLSVRRQIEDNSGQIEDLLRKINTVETMLKSKQRQREAELQKNKRSEEELLLSMR